MDYLIWRFGIINSTGDYLLMQVTSRLRNDRLSLRIKDTDYSGVELLKPSELRLHKIFIINEQMIAGGITIVSAAFMKTVTSELLKLIE